MIITHGTTTGYTRGCRCNECRAASAEYQRKRQAAKRAGTWEPIKGNGIARQQCIGPECDRLARNVNPVPLCGGHLQQVQRGAPLTPLRRVRRVADGVKECSRCGELKTIDSFNGQSKGRRQSACRACESIINRVNLYKLPFAEVKHLLLQPCGGCGAVVTGRNQHIDHDHRTGRVRGVLCTSCNTILGAAKDDPKVLRGLIAYLGRSR